MFLVVVNSWREVFGGSFPRLVLLAFLPSDDYYSRHYLQMHTFLLPHFEGQGKRHGKTIP
jgi:hypothetical protein